MERLGNAGDFVLDGLLSICYSRTSFDFFLESCLPKSENVLHARG